MVQAHGVAIAGLAKAEPDCVESADLGVWLTLAGEQSSPTGEENFIGSGCRLP